MTESIKMFIRCAFANMLYGGDNMNLTKLHLPLFPVYLLILGCFLFAALGGSRAITVLSESAPLMDRKCMIIDAGHGGKDGGATSCTGVLESKINLEIALRLDDLMRLLGVQTKMIRTGDNSVHTAGETIAAQKVSDLKERVRIANTTENAILVSIHQNHYTDSKYSGAQVFYGSNPQSADLAGLLQSGFVRTLNPGSNRKSKKADGIYLLQKVELPAVLVECGFLSNFGEEAKLRSADYQKKLASVIACVCSSYLHSGDN